MRYRKVPPAAMHVHTATTEVIGTTEVKATVPEVVETVTGNVDTAEVVTATTEVVTATTEVVTAITEVVTVTRVRDVAGVALLITNTVHVPQTVVNVGCARKSDTLKACVTKESVKMKCRIAFPVITVTMDDLNGDYYVGTVTCNDENDAWYVNLPICDAQVKFKIDTGADISVSNTEHIQ